MRRKRLLVGLVALAVLVAVGMVALFSSRGIGGWGDPSIVLAKPFRTLHGHMIENGSAFDKAALDIGTAKKVVLPDDAVVRRGGEPGKVRFYMKKTLEFAGHPPESMSIRDARRNMGCAVTPNSGALVVATFGEWDSIEGGARMKLVVQVPEGVEIEQRKGLSGQASAGREWEGEYLTKPEDAKGGYWYGPASPGQGWRAVPDVPDPDRTAG
jgi:hypothetical protein